MSYQLASQPHLVTLANGQTVQLVQGPMGAQQIVNLPSHSAHHSQQFLLPQVRCFDFLHFHCFYPRNNSWHRGLSPLRLPECLHVSLKIEEKRKSGLWIGWFSRNFSHFNESFLQ